MGERNLVDYDSHAHDGQDKTRKALRVLNWFRLRILLQLHLQRVRWHQHDGLRQPPQGQCLHQ